MGRKKEILKNLPQIKKERHDSGRKGVWKFQKRKKQGGETEIRRQDKT
jgi:hypothetical protein